jgi:hypothetical protein
MRTYYKGPDAIVTDEHFIWRSSANQLFAVSDLHNVGLVKGGIAGFRPVAALAVTASLAVATAAVWQAFGAAVGYSVAALAVTVAALTLASAYQRAARIWHVQATYRGMETTVFSSADVRVFNQVTRALRRSIEDSRQARPAQGLASAR